MSVEENLQKFLDNARQVDETYINAAIGKISSDRSKELAIEIKNLHQQIPITISELRETISRNTDKMIKANDELANSNNHYAKWMKYLTLGLVLVGVVQIFIAFVK